MPTEDTSYAARTRRIRSTIVASQQSTDASTYLLQKQFSALNPDCCSQQCRYNVKWLSKNGTLDLTLRQENNTWIYSADYAIVTSDVPFEPVFEEPPRPDKGQIQVTVNGSTYTVSFVYTEPILSNFVNGTGFVFNCSNGKPLVSQQIYYRIP